MRLTLYPRLVDEDPRVGRQPCAQPSLRISSLYESFNTKRGERTSESEADVVVEHGDFPHRPGILQLQDRLLLDAKHDARLAADANL